MDCDKWLFFWVLFSSLIYCFYKELAIICPTTIFVFSLMQNDDNISADHTNDCQFKKCSRFCCMWCIPFSAICASFFGILITILFKFIISF